MINENWMRSIAKSYQQLNEINEIPLGALEGSSMTVSRFGGEERYMRALMADTAPRKR